ncbi:Terpene synthase metal-binding domain-containing protein [Nostoc sp. PCC 7107]|uniref:terpene synthase family protein n=1 Tax=Nostoc sp. PCC 7107 TaxID=317936 RepID=UPI00029ECEF3|nr:Terpene synthase metal-binding domain-containing protein [Nostoc sp. PCC 7107]AFY45837.1 Terpene synthase metal-binding domain-containing protein [Nostoc sp. PCC 7107]
MEKLSFPDLYCPFPSQVNKYVDVLEDYSLEWLYHFDLLANESIYQNFSKSKFFLLAAGTYPYCELEDIKITSDWHTWLFIWDDQCDMSDLGTKPEVLNMYHKRFLEILCGAKPNNQDISLSFALRDLRQRILQRGNEKWFDYFVRCCQDYFYGCVLQAEYRAQRIVPSVNTYIMIRNLCSAVDSCLALIEIGYQMNVFGSIRENHLIKQLNVITNNIISWCNDIFSAPREIGSRDVHNLVFVLHHQHRINLTQAIIIAAEMHDQKVRELINLEASLPSFDQKVDQEVTEYISGLHSWIRGNLDWYFQSDRYQSLESLELSQI